MFASPYTSPFVEIADALGKNKGETRFRVSWSEVLGSGWDGGTMLYDRKRGILKYYDVGGEGGDGVTGDGKVVPDPLKEYYRKSYLFVGIKDSTLLSLVQRYNNPTHIRELYPFAFLDK